MDYTKLERTANTLNKTKAYITEALLELISINAPMPVIRELTYALDALNSAEIEHKNYCRDQLNNE